jgi:hypothetical protein
MTVAACIEAYEKLGARIFANPRHAHVHNKLWPGSKFDYRDLETVIEEVVRENGNRRDVNNIGGGLWNKFADPPVDNALDSSKCCKT